MNKGIDPNENVTGEFTIHDMAERCVQSLLKAGCTPDPQALASVSYKIATAFFLEGQQREKESSDDE